MKNRVIEGIQVSRGSANVFADLNLPDADTLHLKAVLVIEIRRAIRQQGPTQQAAATRMGLTQPKVSSMMRGDFSNVSERKLTECLNLHIPRSSLRGSSPFPEVLENEFYDTPQLAAGSVIRLGYDIEINIRPASARIGHLMLALP